MNNKSRSACGVSSKFDRSHRLQLLQLDDRITPAIATLAAGVLTIDVNNINEIVTISAVVSKIFVSSSVSVSGDVGPHDAGSVTKIVVNDSISHANQLVNFVGTEPFTLSNGLSTTGVEFVMFNNDITATGSSSISVTAPQSITVNRNLIGGSGGLTLNGQGVGKSFNSKGVSVNAGAVVSATGGGPVIVTGKGGGSGGENYGVDVTSNSKITSGDSGTVTVQGIGGPGIGSDQYGVFVSESSQITSGGSGTVSVEGTAGSGFGNKNVGVYVSGGGSRITSGGGKVIVIGKGGASGIQNHGVCVDNEAQITSGGVGTVTVEGIGGLSSGDSNHGVFIIGNEAKITSGGGNVNVVGLGGGQGSSSSNIGVVLGSSGQITSGQGATVNVQGTGGFGFEGNSGVYLEVGDAKISSGGGDVKVVGKGGSVAGASFSIGVIVAFDSQITAGGSGNVSIEGTGGKSPGDDNYGVYVVGGNAKITSGGGNVKVIGIGGGNGSGFSNLGIYVVESGLITSGGSGTVTVQGTGGDGSEGSNYGVFVDAFGQISSGGIGFVTVEGIGGTGSGNNFGVNVSGTNATITSGGGNVTVLGMAGGNTASSSNYGVYLAITGQITSGGSGTVTVQGTGGKSSGVDNYGVYVIGKDAKITSGGGSVSVTAIGNTGPNPADAFRLEFNGSINSGNNAPITITADSMNLFSGSAIDAGSGDVTLQPLTPGTAIDLGGPDVLSGKLLLGLTNAELDLITAGLLVIGKSDAGTITVSQDITAPLNLMLITGDGLTGSKNLAVGAATTTTLTVQQAGTSTFAGTLGGSGTNDNNFGVTFNGKGTLTLTGESTFIGSTTLDSGTLLVNGSLSADSAVFVNNSATLGGTGAVNGNVSIQSGGTVSPGVGFGTLTLGSANFNTDSIFQVGIDSPIGGTGHDQLVVVGSLFLNDAILNASGKIASNPGQTIVLINNQSSSPVVGTFAGLPEGNTVTVNGITFTVTYLGGDGNDVVLTEVPPPPPPAPPPPPPPAPPPPPPPAPPPPPPPAPPPPPPPAPPPPPPPAPPPPPLLPDEGLFRLPSFAIGAGSGMSPFVVIYNGDGTERLRFMAYEESFLTGVRIATGDLNGDGVRDFVVGTGEGGGPRVRVFNGFDGSILSDFFAFEESFRGGVWVAVGDIDGNGKNDIVVGAGVGGGPRVRALRLNGTSIADFFTRDSKLRSGVSVSVADIDGDGISDVITGVADEVVILSGRTLNEVRSFSSGMQGPISVAASSNRIIVGSGVGLPETRNFSPDGKFLVRDQVYEEAFRGGVRVAFSDVNGDGTLETLLGAGEGGGPRARVLSEQGTVLFDFFAFDVSQRGGIFVG